MEKIEITNMMKQSLKVIKKDSHTGKEIDKLDGTTFSYMMLKRMGI